MEEDEKITERAAEFRRLTLRAAFQSLFWHVILTRKSETGFGPKALADAKSHISRSFSSPPNWRVDKLSDMAAALGVELTVQAMDPKTGQIFTPHGNARSDDL